MFCRLDVLNDDGRHDGGSTRRLLATLRTISRHITTAQSATLCFGLAVLHDAADGRAAGAVSLLSRPADWHLLGSV